MEQSIMQIIPKTFKKLIHSAECIYKGVASIKEHELTEVIVFLT